MQPDNRKKNKKKTHSQGAKVDNQKVANHRLAEEYCSAHRLQGFNPDVFLRAAGTTRIIREGMGQNKKGNRGEAI